MIHSIKQFFGFSQGEVNTQEPIEDDYVMAGDEEKEKIAANPKPVEPAAITEKEKPTSRPVTNKDLFGADNPPTLFKSSKAHYSKNECRSNNTQGRFRNNR